jgi:ribosomal-protein-alanine N-acetyltransferase
MTDPYIIGPTLYLRPLERTDAALAKTWLNDPEVARTIAARRPITLQAEEEFITRISQSEHDIGLVIVVREGDRAVGLTGLHHINYIDRHAGFGIVIGHKDDWGKGYATEATGLVVRYAFERLNLNRVWLHVFAGNERGIRAYERVGFKKEGVLRQDHYRDGRYGDTFVMGVLRDEWRG